jgi:adenylate cyclase class 2
MDGAAVLEVEMKFPVKDFAALGERLKEWEARTDDAREDADTYFNAPDRDFAKTDEAVRIRRIGKENYVTYKGPKVDAQTKTRTEIEVQLGPGDRAAEDFANFLQHLGFRPVATVEKRRRLYHIQRQGFALEIALDEVANVGTFAELEIQAEESRLEAAKAVLLETARALGLKDSERRSYLEMFLKNQQIA